MKAAIVTKYGAPHVLKIQDWPDPNPQRGEVKIRVKAIGLNFADVMARVGLYPSVPKPPFIPGIEVCGIITRTGEGVRKWRRGEKVIVFTQFNGYAEYVVVPQNQIFSLPKRMSFEEGAAIGVTYLTAYHGLVTLGHLQKNEKVLIHSAAGGVGTAAIQIAKHLGAEIYATASSDEKLKVAEQQGAHHLINYIETDFAKSILKKTSNYGVDVVLDAVGGKVFKKGWKLLPAMGRYVLFGFAAVSGKKTFNWLKVWKEVLSAPLIFPQFLASRNVSIASFNLFFLMHKTEYMRNSLRLILDWQSNGIVKPIIGATFTFDKIADAQALLQSRKSTGKIVVTVQ